MTSTVSANVTSLDYDGLKESLRSFLSNHPTFTDYDFAGSGLNAIIEVLAYNSQQYAYLANMLSNEMFLDSAILRSSVVSLAKLVGYTPRSIVASQAQVSLTFEGVPLNYVNLELPKGTQFSTKIKSKTFTFVNRDSVSIFPTNAITNPGQYRITNLPIYEGEILTNDFVVVNPASDRFIIPNNNADISTLRVYVKPSGGSTFSLYTEANSILGLTNASTIYYIQEVDSMQFEVYFGDDVLGKSLSVGDTVRLEYIATNGIFGNFARTFTVGSIGGFTPIVTTDVTSTGGASAEGINTIRQNAQKMYSSQDRCVTTQDYRAVIMDKFPYAKSVRVWGGEAENPPKYGKVFVSIATQDGTKLTQDNKRMIINDILSDRSFLRIVPTIVDPQNIFVGVKTVVKYNPRLVNDLTALKNSVNDKIIAFGIDALEGHGKPLYLSNLLSSIDQVSGVVGNISTITLVYRFVPKINSTQILTVNFKNPIKLGSVRSTPMNFSSDQSSSYILEDDSKGNIVAYKLDGYSNKVYLPNYKAGSVDYTNGTIVLDNLTIEDFVGEFSEITWVCENNDIVPQFNQVLYISPEKIDVQVQAETIV
jgi:hypothetical protein